jgi:hypothetical protein
MSKIFKKPFKLQNAHSVSNKDKKKLKDRMVSFGPEITSFVLDDKSFASNTDSTTDKEAELCINKIVGSKVVIYQRGDTPYLFSPDGDKPGAPLLPSLYLMFAS